MTIGARNQGSLLALLTSSGDVLGTSSLGSLPHLASFLTSICHPQAAPRAARAQISGWIPEALPPKAKCTRSGVFKTKKGVRLELKNQGMPIIPWEVGEIENGELKVCKLHP